MTKKDTVHNDLSKQELNFAAEKVNEYPKHIPQYNCDDSYVIILKLLHHEDKLSPKLISKHFDAIDHFHSKITEPYFKEPALSISNIISENDQYTAKQTPRLHLLSVLFNNANTIYNIPGYYSPLNRSVPINFNNVDFDTYPKGSIRELDYAFFANQLIVADLKSTNIPFSLNHNLKILRNIFQEEIKSFQKNGLGYIRYCCKNEPNNLKELKSQLYIIKTEIINRCTKNDKVPPPPFWLLNNITTTKQNKNKKLPPKNTLLCEIAILYTYYVIIWNYLSLFHKIPIENASKEFSDDIFLRYKLSVQACYAFYLLEICPQYYELKELSRTIRYYFAYKVFCATKSLLEAHPQLVNKQVLLLEPYKTTFLKVDYTRPESTAKRKKFGQHSTISEHYDIKLLVEKINNMLYGYLTNDNGKPIYIALPLKNNSRYIGSRNLAYVLGIPESKDFFDKILNKKPVNPKNKISQKISDRWIWSINILSPTYCENNVPFDISVTNNLGFLLNEDELKELSCCVKNLKFVFDDDINKLIREIKAIAKTEKNYITPFDITYFELFYKHLYPYQSSTPPYYDVEYLWFTLPFIHITNALLIITDKIKETNNELRKTNEKLEQIYEDLGKSFAGGKICYTDTDIEKIKIDAIVTPNNTSLIKSPITIKTKDTNYYKYIIKTFKPINEDNQIQKDLLKSYYFSSLNLAMQNNCHSIAFSSYYFEKESFESINILRSWQRKHYGYYIDINICFQSKKDIETMQTNMNNFFADKIKSSKINLIRDFQKRKD